MTFILLISLFSVSFVTADQMSVHGTEYISGQDAKAWLQLLNSTNAAINNAVCYVTVYNPDNSIHVNQALMTNSHIDGIYYYDLIAPNEQGVYPVVATCYYQAVSIPYYATTGQIDYGTYSSGAFSDTIAQDGNFIRFLESTVNPAVRNISIQANFSNLQNCSMVSEDLFTGIDIRSYMKFDSVNGDDITIQIFNHTSGIWMSLPNLHPEGNFFASVSNTINTNNLTKTGLYNTTHGLRIRFRDTQLADGATSNLDIDHLHLACNQLASPQYQEIKGSSEMHVTLAQGEYTFAVNTLCDDEDTDGSCAVFFQNTTILDEPQGLIQENITLTNVNFVDIEEPLFYETGATIDCTGIKSVIEIRSNGSITDLTESTIYKVGHGIENCELKIPVTMQENETQYQITIVMENFAQWELNRGIDHVTVINSSDYEFCIERNTSDYFIPINTLLSGDSITTFCNRHLDDIYWYQLNYDDSLQSENIGDLEGFIQVHRFYYSDIKADHDTIEDILKRESLQNITNITQTNQNWLTSIWNYITGYLTILSQQVNSTTIENQYLLNVLINQTNTTKVPTTATYLTQNCITGSQWTVSTQVYDQYGVLLAYPPTMCEIFTTIDNQTNNMSFQSPDFIHSQSCPTSSSWNFTITCT